MASANDVAAAILEMVDSASTMKLQKLLYYCQGWHLAWEGIPLFEDRIEAWANGPVVRSVYDKHRGHFMVSSPWKAGDPDALEPNERESVEIVVKEYGNWSARELVVATHRERPWMEARGNLSEGARSSREISLDTMQDFFAGLIQPAG